MQKKWLRREVPAERLALLSDMPPLLQRIYAARGIQSPQELERDLDKLLPYQSLRGLEAAIALLKETLQKQETILIVGDFDADGATSTALAVRALRSFGAGKVEFLVPNRFAFGYGLTPELVEVAKTMQPALIVTVDNGIANHAGVTAAKALGIKVLITDHHLTGATLPEADAIVNPNQPGDEFPSKNLAGVGVIFYVMLALRRQLASEGWFAARGIAEPNMARFLDLVALGTVADLVPLDHNNRVLVHQGLKRMRARQCIPAIIALLQIAGREVEKVSASDLGFAVASRLNAAGRLDDMSLGIECLLSDDLEKAIEIARTLNSLNSERRAIENDMHAQALKAIASLQSKLQGNLPRGLCLYDASWHQGVIGILASRIKDKLNRPVIVFAEANEKELKGSARSISGLHIRDTLAHIMTQHPHLITKFGGHAMAAGLTIASHLLEEFTHIFNETVSARMREEDLHHCLLTDGELPAEEFNLDAALLLRDAGPWGQAFPEPLFEGVFRILDQRIVGEKHLKMRLQHDNRQLDAVAFFVNLQEWPNHRCQHIRLAYRLSINEYRGNRLVQLIAEHIEPA